MAVFRGSKDGGNVTSPGAVIGHFGLVEICPGGVELSDSLPANATFGRNLDEATMGFGKIGGGGSILGTTTGVTLGFSCLTTSTGFVWTCVLLTLLFSSLGTGGGAGGGCTMVAAAAFLVCSFNRDDSTFDNACLYLESSAIDLESTSNESWRLGQFFRTGTFAGSKDKFSFSGLLGRFLAAFSVGGLLLFLFRVVKSSLESLYVRRSLKGLNCVNDSSSLISNTLSGLAGGEFECLKKGDEVEGAGFFT